MCLHLTKYVDLHTWMDKVWHRMGNLFVTKQYIYKYDYTHV